jgi:trans-aconitate methyltransferase
VAAQQTQTDRTARFAEYIEARRFDPPRPLLIRAAALVDRKKHAFDFGAGALNATRYLLSAGFERVTALDASPQSETLAEELPRGQVSFVLSRFEDFVFPANCFDLVNAEFCLPFMQRDNFARVLPQLLGSTRTGGIFTGQLFGIRDSWNVENSGMTFHASTEAKAYFSDFDIVELTEEDHPGTTKLGEPKHWHIFHIIAKKR